MTPVSQLMTRGVRTLAPRDSTAPAAQAMHELEHGGAEQTPLEEVICGEPRWRCEDDDVDGVLEQMRAVRVSRIPVFDHAQHLVGILSLGEAAVRAAARLEARHRELAMPVAIVAAAPATASSTSRAMRRAARARSPVSGSSGSKTWATWCTPRPRGRCST